MLAEDNGLGKAWQRILDCNRQQNAIHYNELYFTYDELDKKSSHIAAYLQKHTSSTYVGILLDGCFDYVCAALGTLKAGKCFVPLGLDWPQERIEAIKSDCNLDSVISNSDYSGTVRTIQIESIYREPLLLSDNQCAWLEGNSAYVLYTSGTTGTPKGIEISRSSLLNLVNWFGNTFLNSDIKRILQLARTTFDVSVEEIFGTLFNGGTVFIPSNIIRFHKNKLRQYIEEHEIQLIEVVPSTLRAFFDNDIKIPCLKVIICGADVLPEDLKNSIINIGYELYNNYGPTETTVDAMYSKCEISEPVNLGKCISGCEIALIDESGQIISGCSEGELFIGGNNVALGYINNPELSSEKFIVIKGIRYFKTGDWVFRDNDGRIFFRGRIDNQVKIRGQKIELEEIERVFSEKLDDLQCAATIIRDKNEKLVVFYKSDTELDHSFIVSKMEEKLPRYMIPSLFIRLDELPLTEVGKVDRKALLNLLPNDAPSFELNSSDPVTDKVAQIISDILEIDKSAINPELSFEQLGFDSLTYVRFLVMVEDTWDIELDDFLVPEDGLTTERFVNSIKGMITEDN